METINSLVSNLVGLLWHPWVLYLLLLTGIVFTIWSGFVQYRSLTHGVALLGGKYNRPDAPGALSHFQALSAALSATVGLGNIAGVALAVELGGPGAIFWMWVVGVLGMATKMTEVTLSMLYRNLRDPDNPHGGPMWVARHAVAEFWPSLRWLGVLIGGIFCITLLIATATGGNMFQAWNVGHITEAYFGVPTVVSGMVLAVLVGLVIIGGVKRIGRVAGLLVPAMVVIYLLAALVVLALNATAIPGLLKLILVSAFSPLEAQGAFLGGAMGSALAFGMQRALFSSEAGVGSAPIAHAATRTDKPVRGGIVSGLEPFIDTLVVCTITALVILSTGTWNRDAELTLPEGVQLEQAAAEAWTLPDTPVVDHERWRSGQSVFAHVHPVGDDAPAGRDRIDGEVTDVNGERIIRWQTLTSPQPLQLTGPEVYGDYPGATLTAMSFDSAIPGLGKFMVTLAVWLFALSTMIAWSYYGEQGVIYLFGERAVGVYRYAYCGLAVIATLGLINTARELNNFTALGTGVMLWVNIPIIWLFGFVAMRAYKGYIAELDKGHDAS